MKDRDTGGSDKKTFPRTGRNLENCSTGPREYRSPLAQFFTPTSQCTQPGISEVCNFGIEMPLVSEDTS